MSQLAATNMVYKKFSFDYFLDSMDRLGVHRLELYGCSHHFHMYDGDPNMAANMRKKLSARDLVLFFSDARENTYAN